MRFPPLDGGGNRGDLIAARGNSSTKRAHALARLARGSAARGLALVEGDEPPLKEFLEALSSAKRLDFAGAKALAQEYFGNREAGGGQFRADRADARGNAMLQAARRAMSRAVRPSRRDYASGRRMPILSRALLTCLAAAVRAQAAVEAMANSRLQAEQLWMAIGQAARGE